jgi:hypothetical protein
MPHLEKVTLGRRFPPRGRGLHGGGLLQREGGPVFFEGAVDGLPRESRFLG